MAVLLVLASLAVGWLALRATAAALPGATMLSQGGLTDSPGLVLSQATVALVKQRGILDRATLAEVRQAATRVPLDARPYLILGHQSLLDGEAARALHILEFGQRRDPRQRLIHLILLDRYLRTGRYRDAAAQFSVLSRLVGEAQGPIARAMAEMSTAPETRDAVRRTLHGDQRLEQAVLLTLARSDTDPALVIGLASPAAWATATLDDGWGPALVRRMIDQGRFAAARDVWRRLFRIPAEQLATTVYDAQFRGLPGSPPFNWVLTGSNVGAASLRNGQLAIDYYGRESGQLANQVIVLPPGRYDLSFSLGGSPNPAGATLAWSVACAGSGGASLLQFELPPIIAARQRLTRGFTVPAGCPAQRIVLSGNAAEFPTAIAATIGGLSVAPAGSPR